MLSGQQGFGGLVYKLYTFVLIDLARQPTTLEELSGVGFDLCRAVGGLVYVQSARGRHRNVITARSESRLNTRSNTHTHTSRVSCSILIMTHTTKQLHKHTIHTGSCLLT